MKLITGSVLLPSCKGRRKRFIEDDSYVEACKSGVEGQRNSVNTTRSHPKRESMKHRIHRNVLKCISILHTCRLTRDELPHFCVYGLSQQPEQSWDTSCVPHSDLVLIHSFPINQVPQSSTRVLLDLNDLVV